MLHGNKRCLILSADDDADDQLFMKDAYNELRLNCELMFFPNGRVLTDYLEKDFREIWDSGVPCMIFLDLNMPQLNGKEALELLRNQIHYYSLPIFILTTSASEQDINECYALGANAVLQKPGEFDNFKKMLAGIYHHWMPFLFMPNASTKNKENARYSMEMT
jgi:two-component system response regulator